MRRTGGRERAVTAEAIRSPRALAVLSALCQEDLDVWPRRYPGPLDDPTAHPFDIRRPEIIRSQPGGDPLDDAERLAVEVLFHGAGYAWWGDGRVTVDAVEHRGPAFVDAAQDLLAAPGARWWGDDMAPELQVMLGRPDTPPDIAALAADQRRMFGASFHGRIPQALTTSRRLGDRLPAVLLCDPDAPRPVDGRVGCWAVRVAPDSRVYEIHSLDDWHELLVRYPRRVPTTEDLVGWGVATPEAVVPDWEAFVGDWGGLHVSMLGVLTAQSVPVEVDGVSGVLEDVDADVTAWFRPRLHDPTLIATMSQDELPHFLPWP